jgi:hypothetical protein
MSDTWISTATAAEVWGLHPQSARRAAHLGEVGWKRKGPRGRLWLRAADVEALVITKARSGGADAAEDAAGSNQDLVRKSA